MTGPGDELAELLWDNGPALRRPPPPPPLFQPFTCSAAGSSSARELTGKPGGGALFAGAGMRGVVGLGLPVVDDGDDDPVPWLHCPSVDDDGDSDTAPLPPDYCASLLPQLPAVPSPAPPTVAVERPASPRGRAAATRLPQPSACGGEGVMNFSFFSRPLQQQRPQASAAPSNPVESTVVQAAGSRLRSTPLFSEQRMAWLQPPPPKAPRAAAPAAPPAPSQAAAPPLQPDHCHGETAAATVTQQHRLPPAAAAAAAATATATAGVAASSVCSGNGDRSHQLKRSGRHQPADCSVSPDEDMDDEAGAARRSAARSTKRSRTAEVHNLSERRRRDRINEKMRALQELIPNCNKIDKASMLEEAIEYLKTLQLQVQMMSMGTAAGLCVPPVLLPAMQMQVAPHHHHHPIPMAAHFPHLGMGLGFGVGAAAAAAFDMVPRLAAGAHFPAMFGVPGPQAMAAFQHMAGCPAPAEQMEAAAAAAPGGAPAHPGVPVAATQGEPKLQHPKPA